MRRAALVVVCLIAGSVAAVAAELQAGPPTATPVRVEAPPRVTLEIVSATLGDDCSGRVVPRPPVAPVQKKSDDGATLERRDSSARWKGGPRPCEQTSMQISIVSPPGIPPSELKLKSVELFDETGASVGTLDARPPTVWDGGRYRIWDGKITPGESINISYALSQPDWSHVASRANRTYVMKAVLSVGGADETLEHGATVWIESPETSLPPNVRT